MSFISNFINDLKDPVNDTIEDGKYLGNKLLRSLRYIWIPTILYLAYSQTYEARHPEERRQSSNEYAGYLDQE